MGASKVLKMPDRAPKASAIGEQFLGSVRGECLDYSLVLRERHLHRVIREYLEHFSRAQPYQGIDQEIPERSTSVPEKKGKGMIMTFPVRFPVSIAPFHRRNATTPLGLGR